MQPNVDCGQQGRDFLLRYQIPEMHVAEAFTLGALHIHCRATGRKAAFHDAVIAVARRWKRRPAILLGDSNSGLPGLDEEVPCFGPGEQSFFEALAAHGWRDAFRHFRRHARAYTWYSPNGGNGFRLDQGFVSPALLPSVSQVSHRWAGGRRGGLSDHAALLLDFAEPCGPPALALT